MLTHAHINPKIYNNNIKRNLINKASSYRSYVAKYIPQLACSNYKVFPKHLAYSSKIGDQTSCRLKTKPIGVESCMARVC